MTTALMVLAYALLVPAAVMTVAVFALLIPPHYDLLRPVRRYFGWRF